MAKKAKKVHAAHGILPKVILRFVGRFAYAIPHDASRPTTERIFVIAARFEGDHAREHTTLMTIRRDQLVVGPKATTAKPAFKIVNDQSQESSESWVWTLDGCNITFEEASARAKADGTTTLSTRKSVRMIRGKQVTVDPKIPDLGVLERLKNRDSFLDPSCLVAREDVNHPSQTVIEVRGTGVADAIEVTKVNFVTQLDATDGLPDNDKPEVVHGSTFELTPPDVVQFSVTPTGRKKEVTFVLRKAAGTLIGIVTVGIKEDDKDDVVVGFSNICSELPLPQAAALYDLEFSHYYRLLRNDSERDPLIPKDIPPSRGEIVDCDCIVQMRYDIKTGKLLQ